MHLLDIEFSFLIFVSPIALFLRDMEVRRLAVGRGIFCHQWLPTNGTIRCRG